MKMMKKWSQNLGVFKENERDGWRYVCICLKQFFSPLIQEMAAGYMDQKEGEHGRKGWGKRTKAFPHKISPGYRCFWGTTAIQL